MKDIPGFKGLYAATEDGRIWSHRKQRFVKVHINPNTGRHRVGLYNKKGVRCRYYVYQLICITFHRNPHKKPEVNHIDGNKLNNCAANLEWATRSENQSHAFHTGLNDHIKDSWRTLPRKNGRFIKITD